MFAPVERALRRIRSLGDGDAAELADPALSDDAGTEYSFLDGSSGGSEDRATIGHSDFAPTAPPAARTLVFESLGREIEVPLTERF